MLYLRWLVVSIVGLGEGTGVEEVGDVVVQPSLPGDLYLVADRPPTRTVVGPARTWTCDKEEGRHVNAPLTRALNLN